MISNLPEYFDPNQEYYLDKINYNRIVDTDASECTLNCTDSLTVTLIDNGVRLILSRSLNFEPNALFELSVSFGAILTFDESKKNDFDWKAINLAEEFKENGEFAINNLMSRITLLIAQITSSYGQMPIILPPAMAGGTNN